MPRTFSGATLRTIIEAHRDYLLGLVRRMPDITLLEIEHRLLEAFGERFSSSVLWRFFRSP